MNIQYGDDRDIFKVCYRQNHCIHREDGPAIIYKDGEESWYLDDEYFNDPSYMPLNLFLAYCRWEYKKNG